MFAEVKARLLERIDKDIDRIMEEQLDSKNEEDYEKIRGKNLLYK